MAAALLLAAGCRTAAPGGGRVEAYRPGVSAEELARLVRDLPAQDPEPPAATNASPAVPSPPGLSGRRLVRDDAVVISLRGIPKPEEITEVVDDQGCVTLPHIGEVEIRGLTTSEAERLIEKRYVDGGIFRSVNAIVVAKAGEYFIRGEVRQPGRYPLGGGITLVMAISTSGGYTDFANPKRVNIIRGAQTTEHNVTRIEARQEEDPVIKPNDIIVVTSRWI